MTDDRISDKELADRVLWGRNSDEVLIHSDPHEAIEAYLDSLHPVVFEEIGDVTMYEYKPMTATLPHYFSPLETVLEMLNEGYGNPDGCGYEITSAMKDAEQAFLKAVLAEYEPWACEKTGKKITVNASSWVREHRPDWLEQEACVKALEGGSDSDG